MELSCIRFDVHLGFMLQLQSEQYKDVNNILIHTVQQLSSIIVLSNIINGSIFSQWQCAAQAAALILLTVENNRYLHCSNGRQWIFALFQWKTIDICIVIRLWQSPASSRLQPATIISYVMHNVDANIGNFSGNVYRGHYSGEINYIILYWKFFL